MFKWIDRVYVNARKRVFKNLDTGEILNLELQDDPDNITTESETPLTAYCLNLAQQELVDDMSKNYTGTNITADTVEGYGRINKVYGKTTEEGTGEKSPSNPYVLKCVGDDVNLYNPATSPLKQGLWFATNKIASNPHGWYIVVPITGGQTYKISKKYGTSRNSKFVLSATATILEPANNVTTVTEQVAGVDTELTIQIPVTAKYLFIGIAASATLTDQEKIEALEELKIQKGSVATPWSPYGYGTVETISEKGTNTDSNIVIAEPLCSIGDVRDEIDYSKREIIRRCGKIVLNGTEIWQLASTAEGFIRFIATNSNMKKASHFMCDKLKVVDQTLTILEECITERSISQDNVISITVETNRLSSADVNGFKAFLASNPITIVYELENKVIENIGCSNKITQYADSTTVYNRDGAEIEVSLTNNKAISEINEYIKNTEENLIKSTESDDKTVIKFADGTMIEYGTVTCTYASASLLSANINFSEKFIKVPTLILTRQLALSEAYQQFANIGYNNITTSQATVRIRAEANVSFVAENTMQVCYQAVGRWK